MNKTWKDIEGYEGLYQVSNYGDIKSLVGWNGHKYIKREKILHPTFTTTGYYKIELMDSQHKKRSHKVHRLVLTAFAPKVEGKDVVNHKDGNPLNNHIENLEWCTQRENVMHAYETGLNTNKAKLDEDEIANMYYKQKKSMGEIAKECKTSLKRIREIAIKYGELNKSGGQNKYNINLDELKKEIVTHTNSELAMKYGCPSNLIAVRRYQIKKGRI